MSTDTSHLVALERGMASERAFLAMRADTLPHETMTDEQLLEELLS